MFPHDCHDQILPVHGADFSSELERNLMPDSFICLTTNHPSGRRTFTATRGVDSSFVFLGHSVDLAMEESLLMSLISGLNALTCPSPCFSVLRHMILPAFSSIIPRYLQRKRKGAPGANSMIDGLKACQDRA